MGGPRSRPARQALTAPRPHSNVGASSSVDSWRPRCIIAHPRSSSRWDRSGGAAAIFPTRLTCDGSSSVMRMQPTAEVPRRRRNVDDVILHVAVPLLLVGLIIGLLLTVVWEGMEKISRRRFLR
jgi:hypothetical protein